MLTNPKRKGTIFERELVNQALDAGLTAERAYASNGRALGEAQSVDLTINGERIQAKRRKKLADYLQVPDGCDAVAFRQDRGPTLILMRYEDYLNLLHTHNQ